MTLNGVMAITLRYFTEFGEQLNMTDVVRRSCSHFTRSVVVLQLGYIGLQVIKSAYLFTKISYFLELFILRGNRQTRDFHEIILQNFVDEL